MTNNKNINNESDCALAITIVVKKRVSKLYNNKFDTNLVVVRKQNERGRKKEGVISEIGNPAFATIDR